MTVACADIRPRLGEFVGGDLVPAAATAVREHLQGCAACRGEASRWQQAQKALQRAASAQAVPEGVFVDLQRSIVAAVAAERPVRPRAALGSRVAAAAAAVLCFALGWWSVGADGAEALLEREPVVGTTVGAPAAGVRVVPWAGGRVALRPLAHHGDEPAGGGMMERLRLRTLEEVELPPGAATTKARDGAAPRR